MFIIFISLFACDYFHDPFRAEFHNDTVEDHSTPIVTRIICCELTNVGSVLFTNIPTDGSSDIQIFYTCKESVTLQVQHYIDGTDDIPLKTVIVPASDSIVSVRDPFGKSVKRQIRISLADEDKEKFVYIKKIYWPKTDDIGRGDILVEDLPAKCFSTGATLVYVN